MTEEFPGAYVPLCELKANLFKALAHPIRVRVLEILAAAPEASVTELLVSTKIEASRLSQHLSVLRQQHLVVSERRGSQVYCQLAYPHAADMLVLAKALLTDILEATRRDLENRSTPS